MGTRCNILIKIPAWTEERNYNLPNGERATVDHPEQQMWVYRHWDGYPEETGADLLCLADILLTQDPKSIRSTEHVWQYLHGMSVSRDLTHRMENPMSIPYSLGQYEKTTGEHGDIEWFYTVTVSPPQDQRMILVRTDEVHWNTKEKMYFNQHRYINCGPRFRHQIKDYIAGGTDKAPMYRDAAARRAHCSTITEDGIINWEGGEEE